MASRSNNYRIRYFFLICMCNPMLALQLIGHLMYFLLSLLPFSSCLLPFFSSMIRVSTKFYQVYRAIPIADFVSVVERGLDGVIYIAERLGPLFHTPTTYEFHSVIPTNSAYDFLFDMPRLP